MKRKGYLALLAVFGILVGIVCLSSSLGKFPVLSNLKLPNFLNRDKNALPKVEIDKKTGAPKVKNYIANGDFKEHYSIFGQIKAKILPQKPNQPPEGWEFYKENPSSPDPEVKVVTGKPYTYVKDSALYVNAKDKGVGISQKLPSNLKSPFFIQVDVLAISGGVKMALANGKGEVAESREVLANGGGLWTSLAIAAEREKEIRVLTVSALDPNSAWYVTNVVVRSTQDYQQIFESIKESGKKEEGQHKVPTEPDKNIEPQIFYDGKRVDDQGGGVLGAALGETTIRVSNVYFEYDFSERYQREAINWVGESWKNTGVDTSLDVSQATPILFDPFTPSRCELRGAWIPVRVFMPDSWCLPGDTLKLVFLKFLGWDGWSSGMRIYINSAANWGGIKYIVMHELGHVLGAPDSDFVVIAGNTLFPKGHQIKEDYQDIMCTFRLRVSEYTRGIINSDNHSPFAHQVNGVNLIDSSNGMALQGWYKLFLGKGVVHSTGSIDPRPAREGFFSNGVLPLGEQLFKDGYTTAFLAVGDGNKIFTGDFDVMELSCPKFKGQGSLRLPLEQSSLGSVKIVSPNEGDNLRSLSSTRVRVIGDLPLSQWVLFAEFGTSKVIVSRGDRSVDESMPVISEEPEDLLRYIGPLKLILEAEFITEEAGGYAFKVTDTKSNLNFEYKPLIYDVGVSYYGEISVVGDGFGDSVRNDVRVKLMEASREKNLSENDLSVVSNDRLLTKQIPGGYRLIPFAVLVSRDGISSDRYEYAPRPEEGTPLFDVIISPPDQFLDPDESYLGYFEFKCKQDLPNSLFGLDTTNSILGDNFHKYQGRCRQDQVVSGHVELGKNEIVRIREEVSHGSKLSWFICSIFPDAGNGKFEQQDPEIIRILRLARGNDLFYDCRVGTINISERVYDYFPELIDPLSVRGNSGTVAPGGVLPVEKGETVHFDFAVKDDYGVAQINLSLQKTSDPPGSFNRIYTYQGCPRNSEVCRLSFDWQVSGFLEEGVTYRCAVSEVIDNLDGTPHFGLSSFREGQGWRKGDDRMVANLAVRAISHTDSFPVVVTPLRYSYVPDERLLVLWAEVGDDRGIQLFKFWYREAKETATEYEQSNPAEGWVLMASSDMCSHEVGSCYPSFAWELPASIDLTKSYQIIVEFFDNGVDETSGFHFGTTGDVYRSPEPSWYRTRELLVNPGPLAMYNPSTYCLGKPSPSIMVDYTGTCYRCLNEQVVGEVAEEVCRVARAQVCRGIATGDSVIFEGYLCSCNADYVAECSPYIPPNPLACSGIGVCSGSCPVGQVCIPGADNYCTCQPECSGLGVCSGSCRPGYECKVAADNYCSCFASNSCRGKPSPSVVVVGDRCQRCQNEQVVEEITGVTCRAARVEACHQVGSGQVNFETYTCSCNVGYVDTCYLTIPPNPCQEKPENTVVVADNVCYRCAGGQGSQLGDTVAECRAAKANACQTITGAGPARFETYSCTCNEHLVVTCTALPQFGTCGACSSDAWGGCTPPEECRLVNDQALCQANNKPDAPCCLRDQSCAPGQRYDCGYASPGHYCDKCHRFQNYSPWCTDWQYDCGAGAPARPRLKSPANAATISEVQSMALSWYAFGEGLPEKCGESIAGNWPSWEDCHGEVHWNNTPAKCISEVGVSGGNAGDRDCWGYVCARGSLGIPPAWRFYKVLVKGPADSDFREVCSLRDIPNPPGVGQGLPAEKTSCPFTPLAGGHYQWFVRAGYSTATQGGIYTNQTDSPISSFTFSIPADAFPTVSQPLRIGGSGREWTAFLTGDDDVAIEKVLVHYAAEGQSHWQEVVNINCGQKICSLNQAFTLPENLAPGNYTFVASLWDHVIPAAGQHFGTTGANTFLSSDCTPTSTYCYSDKLRFNLAVQPPASGSPQCTALTLDKTQAAPEDPVRVGVTATSGSSNFKATSAITLVALRVSDNSTHGILTFSRCDGVDAKTTPCTDTTQGFTPAHAQIPQAGLYKFYVAMVNREGKTCDDFPGTPAANQCGCGAKDLTVTAPPAPDAFPTVTQALRVEGAGKDFRAMAAGEDETAIEKMVVHYALEGQANWQEVVNVSCGQRQCSLNQAFTLPQALSPGRYKFVASLWDHAVPAAGQHFGTTGANFESSDCSPTATYCHSDQLQFILEVQPPAPFRPPACSVLSLSPQSGTFTTDFRANLSCTSGSNPLARLYLMIRKSGTTGARIRLTPGDGLCFGQTACTTSFTFKPANFPGLGSEGSYDVWLSSRTAGPDGQLETADDGRCTDIPEGLEEVGRCGVGVKPITLTAPCQGQKTC